MVVIVGAGPIGSYLGYKLSLRGVSNTILEEHSSIGKPEQCTGLISKNIEELLPKSWYGKAVQNKVKGALISCGKKSFEIKSSGVKAYVFDRSLFDQAIADKAMEKGSKVLLNHKYVNHKDGKVSIKDRKSLISDVLVGADGPFSSVAKNAGLYGDRKFLVGTQVIGKCPDIDKEIVHVYLDKKYSDGFFSWVVPIDDEKVKIGLASFTNVSDYMKRFMKQFSVKVVERHAGLIPLYSKIPVCKDNVYLVGDAALQVKATSGGGVVNGMMAANALCDTIIDGVGYEKGLKKVRRNLWLHSFLRRKMNKISDDSKKEAIGLMNSEKVKKVLLKKGDMDFPKKFLFKLLLKEPRLLKYLI